MTKNQKINGIFKILALFEDAKRERSNVLTTDYLSYINRLAIMYEGLENIEFYGILKGIYSEGMDIEHSFLKSLVFHMINTIDGGDK